MLEGNLDFLDGLVIPYWDDDTRRLWDTLIYVQFKPVNHLLYVPFVDNEPAREQFGYGLQRLADAVLKFSRVRVEPRNLATAIKTYNEWRDVMEKLYELRKRDVPPLTGAEYLGLTTASFVIPKDEYTKRIKELMPYLETRKAQLRSHRPRIMVSAVVSSPLSASRATLALNDGLCFLRFCFMFSSYLSILF